jgi:hypothetical protein
MPVSRWHRDWPVICERAADMTTPSISQLDPATGPAAEHCLHELADKAKLRLGSPKLLDLAVAAVAGLALGYLIFSPRRSRGLREVLMGTVLPFAKEYAHDAYEAIADHKHLDKLRRQASKIHVPW